MRGASRGDLGDVSAEMDDASLLPHFRREDRVAVDFRVPVLDQMGQVAG